MATTPEPDKTVEDKKGDGKKLDKELADMMVKLESKDYKVLSKEEYDAIMAVRPKTVPTPYAWSPFNKYTICWYTLKTKGSYPKYTPSIKTC